MGSLMQRRRDIIASEQSILPIEYQQVDYVKIVNWSFLKSSYVPTRGDAFEIVYMPLLIEGYTKGLIYAGNGTYQLAVLAYNYTDNGVKYQMYYYKYFAAVNSASKELFPRVEMNKWYKMTISSDGTLSVNGYSVNSPYEGEPDGTTTNLWIFRRNNDDNKFDGKLRKLRITNNGVLKLNLVPCVRKSDGVAGMYDTVLKEFLTNVKNEGAIIPSTLDT